MSKIESIKSIEAQLQMEQQNLTSLQKRFGKLDDPEYIAGLEQTRVEQDREIQRLTKENASLVNECRKIERQLERRIRES